MAVVRSEHNEVRVILVGRTGLDAALRLDPGVELIRVQQPLEAVGELASPVDASSPLRSVVVLSPEVEWALRQPNNGHGREAIEDFVRGLRVADPGVVVMGVIRNGSGDSPRGTPLDGTIAADLSSEMLRAAIRQQAPEVEEAVVEEEPEPEPEPVREWLPAAGAPG